LASESRNYFQSLFLLTDDWDTAKAQIDVVNAIHDGEKKKKEDFEAKEKAEREAEREAAAKKAEEEKVEEDDKEEL